MQRATDHSPDPDSAVSIPVGRILRDRYVIQERLGSGARGAVFKALDRYRSSLPENQQYVALHCGADCSEQTIQALTRELHCGQLLSHRNIVNVFEFDRDADVAFFTMEFLEGELLIDLIERLRPAAMQRLQAWQIIRQLGAGLAHAHERGIVHGDLRPRNILVTRDGEVRILGFGTAAPATPAYASCELLEGRAVDPRDDLYALACICYELLSGAHPFASRPANLARDFGVEAPRPAGLTGRQWRTLQTGLSWHRAGRSVAVHAWIQKLTNGIAEKPFKTPLLELTAARAAPPPPHSRVAAAFFALLLITAMGIAQLRATSARKASDSVATPVASSSLDALAPAATPASEAPQPEAPADAQLGIAKVALDGMTQRIPAVRQAPFTISVDGYQVSSGNHFVEIRVHRNLLQNASFAWWTEPATARADVDFVQQAKAIQTFPTDRRSTRFYVKLLPDSERSQRDYFFVAIAQPGHGQIAPNVTRVPIWLPTSRDQLQARR